MNQAAANTTNKPEPCIVINGFAFDAQYILSALRAQVRAEDAVDPEGLFHGLDSIRARAALAKHTST